MHLNLMTEDGRPPHHGLVGDIGGTNARFALTELTGGRPRILDPLSFACDSFDSAEQAIDTYLDEVGAAQRPRSAVIAVAGPIAGGRMSFTNGVWSLSEQGLAARGFRLARLINDYEALALGAADLGADERLSIGPAVEAAADPNGTIAVIGAGTGFGVAALARNRDAAVALTTEGGHAGFAPADDVETDVLRILARRYGRVSIERLLSGPGLRNLYEALSEVGGARAPAPAPEEITRLGLERADALCSETLDRFCAIFGSVAGDFALSFGARGGVYLAGGIAPRILSRLRGGRFRERFEAKGRFEGYLRAIPTSVIVQPHTALIGAAEQLRRARQEQG